MNGLKDAAMKPKTQILKGLYSTYGIVNITESHCDRDDEGRLRSSVIPRKSFASQPTEDISIFNNLTSSSAGIIQAFPSPLISQVTGVANSVAGRVSASTVCLPGEKLRMVTLYVPAEPTARVQFLEDLLLIDLNPENLPMIICGDFNFVENQRKDLKYSDNRVPTGGSVGAQQWSQIKSKYKLVDPYVHEEDLKFTFSQNIPDDCIRLARLDRFYISSSLLSRVVRCYITNQRPSDHWGIVLEIELSAKTGPGYRRLYMNDLRHPEVKEFTKSTCLAISRGQYKWTSFKQSVKKLALALRPKRCNAQLQDLEVKLQEASDQFMKVPSKEGLKLLSRASSEHQRALEEQDRTSKRSYKLRLSLQSGKINAKIFSRFLKSSRADFSVTVREDGSRIETPQETLTYTVDYFRKLYKSAPWDEEAVQKILQHYTARVDPNSPLVTGEWLTVDNMIAACRKLNVTSCGGIDGLPPQFYRDEAETIGPVLYDLLKIYLETGVLSHKTRS